jgi:hypothetical protein
VGRRARPSIFGSALYDSSANRISFHISNRIPEVPLIQHGCFESSLPQVAGFRMPRIEVASVVTVSVLQREAEGIFAARNDNQVNMVVHQAPRPDFQRHFGAMLREQLQVDMSIGVVDKDFDFSVSTLRHVMW